MSENTQPKPPAAWLDHLHESGHWDRLIEMGSKSLSVDPQDAEVHRHLAWAYAKTDRFDEMRGHVDFLLKSDPDDPRHHHLAAIHALEIKEHARAKPHIDRMLAHDPYNATHHYLACIYHLRCNEAATARAHIREARALAPEWAAAAHLEINMDGIHQKKARQAWNRIHRLEETLSFDPEDTSVMTTIGDIYLGELERPRDAEAFYRQALSIDPTDGVRQQKLLDAIRARSLLYRTLCLPLSALRHAKAVAGGGSARWVWYLICFKALIAFLVWMVLMGAFFTPAAKIYEWFVLTDISRTRWQSRFYAPVAAILAWPLWLRLLVVWGVIIGGWVLVLGEMFRTSPATALEIIGWIFGVHFAIVSVFVGVRRARAGFGRWQENRQSRQRRHLSVQTDAE